MTEKMMTYGCLDYEDGELEFPIKIEYDAWDAEPAETGPEAQYPGCAAGVSICDISVVSTDETERVI